jgi:hypothetical protein
VFQPLIYNDGSSYCEKSQDAPSKMSVIDQAVVVDWTWIKTRSMQAARCGSAIMNNLKRGVCAANECTAQKSQNHGGWGRMIALKRTAPTIPTNHDTVEHCSLAILEMI